MMRNNSREKINDDFIFNTRKRKCSKKQLPFRTKTPKLDRKGKGKIHQLNWKRWFDRVRNPILVEEIKMLNNILYLLNISNKELPKRKLNFLLERINEIILEYSYRNVCIYLNNNYYKWVTIKDPHLSYLIKKKS